VCAIDEDDDYESGSDREGEDEEDYSDHDSGPKDQRDTTGTDVYVADDQDREDETLPRLTDTDDQDRTSHAAENLHPGGVKRRPSSTLPLARDAPTATPSLEAERHGQMGTRWLALDQRHAAVPDALPLGDMDHRTKRSNSPAIHDLHNNIPQRALGATSQAQRAVLSNGMVGPFNTNHPPLEIHQACVQFEHQRNGSNPGELLVSDGVVGPFYTNCPSLETAQGLVGPFNTNRLPLGDEMNSSNTHLRQEGLSCLENACLRPRGLNWSEPHQRNASNPGQLLVSNVVVGPFNTNCPPLGNASNSPPSYTQQDIAGVGEISPGARPPRYAQGNPHVPSRQHGQVTGDNRPGVPIFPPGLSRPRVGADLGLNTEEPDQSGDKIRSLTGQRLTGQVRHDDSSHNLTNDFNDLSYSPEAARSEFHSPMALSGRVVLGGVHVVTDRS
jgi:hypothetical protein